MNTNLPNLDKSNPTFNPYASPAANLQSDNTHWQYNDSPFYARKGRIGRLRYLAYGVILSILSLAIFLIEALIASYIEETAVLIIVSIPASIGIIYAQLAPAIRRLNDFNRSGWWAIFMLIPYLNLITFLCLIFISGDEGVNDYGTPAKPPSRRVKALALIVPIIALLGILAAIALPAYQSYVAKAQSAQLASPK